MRDYEIVYIFRSTFTPEEVEAKLERYHAILTEGGQGEITAVEQWGKRQLAYPIQKQTNGHYVVAQFTAQPAPLAELERVLKLEDDLLRYLVVLSEGELPIPDSMREVAPTAPRAGDAAPAADAEKTDGDEKPVEDAEKTDGDAKPAEDAAEDAAGPADAGDAEGSSEEGDADDAGEDDAAEDADAEADEASDAEAPEDDEESDDADEKEE